MIESGSSLVAILFAVGMGSFYGGTSVYLSVFVAGDSALVLAEAAVQGLLKTSGNDPYSSESACAVYVVINQEAAPPVFTG